MYNFLNTETKTFYETYNSIEFAVYNPCNKFNNTRIRLHNNVKQFWT
jgi:hypothetical protein